MDNADGAVVDPRGHPLPPCIVMERGESLDIWSERAKPDRMQAFSVRAPPVIIYGSFFFLCTPNTPRSECHYYKSIAQGARRELRDGAVVPFE